MSKVAEAITVEREIAIAASPETVWELLTDEDEARLWMGVAASFDLRPGGAYSVEVIRSRVARGSFVEIDPPRRLVYTWGWEDSHSLPPGSTTVEFDLVPHGAGTLLRLRHSNLPDVDAAESHGRGWEHYLPRLSQRAAGEHPGPDPWLGGPEQPANERSDQ